jgi:hypothetical protein
MDYKITVNCGLSDTKRMFAPNCELPNDFIPRVEDTLVLNDLYWDVYAVVMDYHYKEIKVWVKDSVRWN